MSPSQSSGYRVDSSAGPLPLAVPIAEIVEVNTTRWTPSAAAASTATTGPSAFISQTLCTGFEATLPATWNSTSIPRSARRIDL